MHYLLQLNTLGLLTLDDDAQMMMLTGGTVVAGSNAQGGFEDGSRLVGPDRDCSQPACMVVFLLLSLMTDL